MSKLKHTAGPWKISFSSKKIASKYIIDNNGTIITAVTPAMNHTKNVLADSRLIAAAPEMLEGHTDIMKIIKGFEIGNLTAETAIGMIKIISETRIINATGLSIEEVLSE